MLRQKSSCCDPAALKQIYSPVQPQQCRILPVFGPSPSSHREKKSKRSMPFSAHSSPLRSSNQDSSTNNGVASLRYKNLVEPMSTPAVSAKLQKSSPTSKNRIRFTRSPSNFSKVGDQHEPSFGHFPLHLQNFNEHNFESQPMSSSKQLMPDRMISSPNGCNVPSGPACTSGPVVHRNSNTAQPLRPLSTPTNQMTRNHSLQSIQPSTLLARPPSFANSSSGYPKGSITLGSLPSSNDETSVESIRDGGGGTSKLKTETPSYVHQPPPGTRRTWNGDNTAVPLPTPPVPSNRRDSPPSRRPRGRFGVEGHPRNTHPSSSGVAPELYDAYAPPGSLGIVVDTTPDGPVVHSLKIDSPLIGMVHVGDVIVALDDIDTRVMDAGSLTRLMMKKSEQHQRKITLLNMDS